MERIHRVALTGGPSGGKTSLQRAITHKIPEAYCVPEIATILMSGGFPAPNSEHTWNNDWQRSFQEVVAAGQIAIEEISLQRAGAEDKKVVVFDRGLIDGASYLPMGVAELEDITGIDEKTMLGRYDLLLHLTTSAAYDAYDKNSNPHRFEEAEMALELDHKIIEVWKNHPNRIILDEKDKQERVRLGLNIIRKLAN